VAEPVFLDPWPQDPAEAYAGKETIERAFVAALHRLPANQRGADPAGFACYQLVDGAYRLGAVNVLGSGGGRIGWLASFLEPATVARFGHPEFLGPDR